MSDPRHAKQEMNAGVSTAMLELSWRRYEYANGKYDDQYIRELREALQTFLKAGQKVTLALGLHDTPAWVHKIPNSHFVDQYGNVSSEFNLVFNQALRDQVHTYITHVMRSLGHNSFHAVRITSGGLGEVLYPPGGSYWAFDRCARGVSAGMPKTMKRNPVPGYRPGGDSFKPDSARLFMYWYLNCMVNVLTWQRHSLFTNGFRGLYYALTPGVGVRPVEYEQIIKAGLPNGLMGVGAVWYHLYSQLPIIDRWVVYCSSVADGSGNDDVSQLSDSDTSIYSDKVLKWSAVRLQARIARGRFMPICGENPGFNYSYRDHYRDLSPYGMMAKAKKQIIGCGLQEFYWAHGFNLWDGTVPFSAYAKMVKEVNK
jgi:hypothetical protein